MPMGLRNSEGEVCRRAWHHHKHVALQFNQIG
jgi:hypothetical protein